MTSATRLVPRSVMDLNLVILCRVGDGIGALPHGFAITMVVALALLRRCW
jgi:hypothetical protein